MPNSIRGRTSTPNPLRVGILGCGHLTQKGVLRHLLCDDFRQHADVAALCDVVVERVQAVAERYSIPQHYTDLNAMLDRADIDVVLVLTPVQHHYTHTVACLRAGKHVYVQKTMALTFEQASEMLETAKTNGLTLAAAPGQMLSPAYRQIQKCIETGDIGQPMWCYAGTTTGNVKETIGSDGIDNTWQYHHGGGALWNTTVYSLHALTGILGPVRGITAMMNTVFPQRTRAGMPFEVTETDNAMLTLEFESNVLGFSWGCRSRTGKVLDWGAIGFYGTEGSLECTKVHLDSGWPEVVECRNSGTNRTFHYPKGGFATGDGWNEPIAPVPHADILEPHVYFDLLDFVCAIHGQRQPAASAIHAAHVVEIIEKAYLAKKTGQSQIINSRF